MVGVLQALVAFQFQTKHFAAPDGKAESEDERIEEEERTQDRGDGQWSAELM